MRLLVCLLIVYQAFAYATLIFKHDAAAFDAAADDDKLKNM